MPSNALDAPVLQICTIGKTCPIRCTEACLLKNKRNREETLWLKALGEHINQIIIKKGYKSAYDFWIQSLGEDMSRASLNYILKGSVDAKTTTIKKIADALEVAPREILNFKIK